MKSKCLRALPGVIAGLAAWSLQGDLTPPTGPPGSVMKTLDQIEPRIPISKVPYTITAPGSYYLTGNLTVPEGEVGIRIESDNVTVDLMGYTLQGEEGSLTGIWSRHNNITVRNGVISGFGVNGIDFGLWHFIPNEPGESMRTSLIEHLHVFNNAQVGIVAGSQTIIRYCIVAANGSTGILARGHTVIEASTVDNNQGGGITVRDAIIINSVVSNNAGVGIRLTTGNIHNSISTRNGDTGIRAEGNVVISGSTISRNGGTGITAAGGGRIFECSVVENGGHGIQIRDPRFPLAFTPDGSAIVSCTAYRNGGAGIQVYNGFGTRVEANNVVNNAIGIEVIAPGNLIVRNSARGNTEANYKIADGNEVGPIGSMGEVGTNPWANFVMAEAAPASLTSEENE